MRRHALSGGLSLGEEGRVKVFIVLNDWQGTHIVSVFSKLESAKKFARSSIDYIVEEWEVIQ